MNNQSIMRISRSNEIKNNLDQAILWLDSINFEAGYIIMVNYFVNGPGSDVDAVLALGLKTGKGRSAYKVISATKPYLIWGVIFSDDDLPDASSLAHGEEYLYKDPKTNTWYIINLNGSERVFNEISDTPKTYINLADGTFWVSNENKRVSRINDIADYYTREEIDILISRLDANIIQDNTTSYNKTWSSSKISEEISGISIDIIQDNGDPSLTKTWSSSKINSEITGLIDDNKTDLDTTWSSEKISIALSGLDADLIRDDKILTTKTWSSSKIDTEINSAVSDVINDNETELTKTWSSSKINSEINSAVSDVINDNETELTKTWSSSKINDLFENIDTDVIDDNETELTKTWSSSKISPVYNWAMGKIEEEYLSKFSVTTPTVNGQTYYTDESLQTTMTVYVNTKFDNQLVNADLDTLPNGWTNIETGKYSKSITNYSGTISAATFYYTISPGLVASGNSIAKSINSVNPAWWGVVPNNDPTAEITSQIFSNYLIHRITSNYNQTLQINNPNNATSYLWILTKNTADATQFGGLSLFSGYTSGKSFISPKNNSITMSDYKLYIATNPVAIGGSYGNVNLKINL